MSKRTKILVVTTVLTIGTTIAAHTIQSKTSIQSNTNVQNIKLLVDAGTTQSNLLPNSIVYTNNVDALSQGRFNGINGLLIAGEISFNKSDMKIKVTNWGTNYLLDTSGVGPFAKFTLFNGNLQSKYSLQTYKEQVCTVINELNNKPFNYGDIISVNLQDTNHLINSGVLNNKKLISKDNPYIPLTSIFSKGVSTYMKITPQGLILMNGLYTAPDGNKYYFQNGHKVTKAGLQTIDGKIYYFDNNGVIQTGWQTIDGSKYYFDNNGVMQTGWQTIDRSKYYFDNNGVMQTGFKKIDGSVYEFNNNGKLIDKVTIAIEGATNKTISAGSQFDPLKGITLNDKADPTAKIEVSGTVNTKIPGVYTLIYTVTDSYGQTARVTREITVTNSINSNTEDTYWSQQNLVINGNIDGVDIPKSLNKKLVIMNSNNKMIDSINTTAVNWYSNNKNNYSGFQGIVTPSILSTLKSDETYKFYIEVNGNYIPLTNNIKSPYNKNYVLSINSNNQLTINKIDNTVKPINAGNASYEVGYFTNNGYVINGNLSLNNNIFSKAATKLLLVKDTQGNIIDTINCASMNWYSINKNNYSGFQGIIPYSVLDKLGVRENYTLFLETIVNGKIYETPINNTEKFILNDSIQYNISTNSKNNIIITKAQTYPVVNSGTGLYQSGYWMLYGYIMNIKVDIGKEIPKGTKMQLISKNLDGQVVSVTTGVDVNWYSNNKNNYNGFQAIITPKQLVMASTSNKLYIRVNINGKTYEAPVEGNLNIYGTESLNYGFKTVDNQINLIINN
ncbi:immunoglobulin-like domain-containing protein [Clostridium massiliamazoniense]|uniref:immunoglobulin-like domain-containing protein n=1 Tax=Clostridium massiliamazoniense TaxID=1347366 RepID=UPI0006D7FDAB|nr:immunoglobulin-like domain-containing protein [Clostridium massiliamazoniense]